MHAPWNYQFMQIKTCLNLAFGFHVLPSTASTTEARLLIHDAINYYFGFLNNFTSSETWIDDFKRFHRHRKCVLNQFCGGNHFLWFEMKRGWHCLKRIIHHSIKSAFINFAAFELLLSQSFQLQRNFNKIFLKNWFIRLV